MAAPHYQIIRRPIITEKGLGVKETQHTVVFEVSSKATKTEIKEAVQKIWDVQVISVNTINRKGKTKRRRYVTGKRPDRKIAIITLREGDSIEIFEAAK
jgi:large subunit ribosomal protein L23